MSRLAAALTAAMRAAPAARAGTLRESRTFAELLAGAEHRAGLLGPVLPRGGRALLTLGNHPDYIATLLAVWARGALPILADPALGPAEIDTLVASCGIDVVIRAPGVGPAAGGESSAPGGRPDTGAPGEHPDGGTTALDERSVAVPTGFAGPRPELATDTELGRLTSGSTRAPACIEFSAHAVLTAARTWIAASGLHDGDTVLCFAGLYNGLAFNTTLIPALLTGADLVLPGGMPSAGAVLRHVAAARPSILVAFPAAYERLTDYTADRLSPETAAALAGIRLRLSSAAPLPAAVAAHVAALSGPISDYYGIAETGPVTFADGIEPGNGRVLPGVTVEPRPRPDGTEVLHVRTGSMGTRYLNYPGEFERAVAADGSYATSDTGTVVDGVLHLGGRAQPVLNIGGRKFTAESVAAAVLAHPSVTDCRVLALTTPSGRACVGAAVQAAPGLDTAALRRFLRGRLAAYKVPEILVVTEQLPRGATGKVAASAVRALLTATFPQSVSGGR